MASDLKDVLFPYQQNWISDNAPIKLCVKSRRIGITWAEALDAVIIASGEKYQGGSDYLYISTREELAKEFIDTAKFWALKLNRLEIPAIPKTQGLFEDPEKAIKIHRIDFASGHTIYALSSNPSNLRGMQGVVCIDEAAHQPNFDQVMKAATALLMWGGKLRIISTHHGEANKFNAVVKSVRAGKLRYSLHEYPIDLALTQGLYKRICQVRGLQWSAEGEKEWLADLVASYGDYASEELYCIPSQGGSHFFNRTVVEDASEPGLVLRFKCSPDFIKKEKYQQTEIVSKWLDNNVFPKIHSLITKPYRSYAGLDFGRSHDLTVLSIIVEDNFSHDRRVPLMIELRNTPFHCQAQIVGFVLQKFKGLQKSAFDSTGNGSYLAEEMSLLLGARKVDQVKLTTDYYLNHFPRYKSALESREVIIPDDEDIIDDHLTVELINGVPKVPNNVDFLGKDLLPRHGDAAISLMLAYSVVPDRKRRKVIADWAQTHSYYNFAEAG